MPLLDVNGVKVDFPFEPYPCQVTYMEKVITCLQQNQNGVLESPTGTGKTLCLLCSTLAWLQGRKAQTELKTQLGIGSLFGDQRTWSSEGLEEIASSLEKSTGSSWGGNDFAVPKIIYASRTHSQLTQAIQELKRTAYSSVKVAVLGSREQLCIHDQVKKEASNAAKVHLCRAKVNARNCCYYNHFDELKRNGASRQAIGNVVDIEDIVSFGGKQKSCPYYLARELKTDADIIFLPYNYILDPKSRKSHGIELQGHIIIFDEAHNLEKICEDSASFDLSSTDLALAIEELTQLSDKVIQLAEAELGAIVESSESASLEPEFNLEDLLRLKATLKNFEIQLDELELVKDGITKPGCFIFEMLRKVQLTYENKNLVLELLDKIISYLISDTTASIFNTKGAGLSKFADILKTIFNKEVPEGSTPYQHQRNISESYKVHIHEEVDYKRNKLDVWTNAGGGNSKRGRILSYWCFCPGLAMYDLSAHGVKCIILTSGTLSPINSFTAEMQISFPVQLQNPHVIGKHQVWVGTIGKGPDGVTLNSNYETRFNPNYQASLGNTIVNFARVIPNGLLVFFPSYPVMNKCLEYWQEINIWNRIVQYKPIFVEPKGKCEFQQTMDGFYTKINDPTQNGAIFIAVCRGKVSEGLDFGDINGRAVVITGLPFPPSMDPKVILKVKFLDEMHGKIGIQSLKGRDWYRQQALRAVNQAIGRVIRHKQDYGAIILCDTRFTSSESVSQLPIWIKPYVNKCEHFGSALKQLTEFFKTAERTLPGHIPKRKVASKGISDCQGAYFEPTIIRSRGACQVQQANMVINHVPSLRRNDELGASDSNFKMQYNLNMASSSSGNHGLLDALDHAEKTAEDSYRNCEDVTSSSINIHQRMNAKKQPLRKKIVIVKRIEQSSEQGGPSLGLASSSAVVSKDHIHTAGDYISMVKKAMSAESYRVFSNTLLNYKKTEDLISLTATLADLFTNDAQNFHLLRKFYRFVRPKHKKQFDEMCHKITGEGCGFKVEHMVDRQRLAKLTTADHLPHKCLKLDEGVQMLPSSTITGAPDCSSTLQPFQVGSTSNVDTPSSVQNIKNLSKPSCRDPQKIPQIHSKSGYLCSKCKLDAFVPLKAPCSHICCLKCWKEIFSDKKECPACRERVRRCHLKRLFFPSGPGARDMAS